MIDNVQLVGDLSFSTTTAGVSGLGDKVLWKVAVLLAVIEFTRRFSKRPH